MLNTGNGLKDVAGAMKSVDLAGTTAVRVAPNLEAFKEVVAGWKTASSALT